MLELSREQVVDVSRHLVSWGSLIQSHHTPKLGAHRSCESGDIPFFICHVTTILKSHVTLQVGSSHPKSPPCHVWGPSALWNWK